MTAALHALNATELLELYRKRELSPVDVTRSTLERIEARNPALNCYCFVDPEAALAAARASERRWRDGAPAGLLDGVPTAIKDLVSAKGWPTWRGTHTGPSSAPAQEDSPPVERLRAHGAVLLGKTTLPELAWKGVTDSPRFGLTRNPWDPDRTPGGSSGGSAAAVAAELCVLAHGTDGSGSVRIPAAFCGIFGFKPTYGLVPQYPVPSQLYDIVHTGPLTRTVRDGALMFTVMSRPDARDWTAVPAAPDYTEGLANGVRGLRVGYSHTLGYAQVDEPVGAVIRDAVHVFEQRGAHVEEVDPGFEDPRDIIDMLYMAGLARVVFQIPQEQREMMDPALVAFAAEGLKFSATDYVAARMKRDALALAMTRFYERYDLLLTPQVGLTAFEVGRNYPAGRGHTHWFDWAPFSYPFNLTQQPAATVPCGLAGGLPVALQIVGPKFADGLVLRASFAFEEARPIVAPPGQ